VFYAINLIIILANIAPETAIIPEQPISLLASLSLPEAAQNIAPLCGTQAIDFRFIFGQNQAFLRRQEAFSP